jgi:hypothetical protein
MKPYHFLFIVALVVFSACDKPYPPQGSFNAKLVASFCAFQIVQIVDADGKGQGMDWKDPSGKQYTNVFTVNNHCDFTLAGLKTGDSFKAVIVEQPTISTCAVCFGYMDTPPLKWNIKVVE